MADSTARFCLVQWELKNGLELKHLFEKIEFYVEAASGYNGDFVLFPEFINASLLEHYQNLNAKNSIIELSKLSNEFKNKFCELSRKYSINIISGSMPAMVENKLRNTGYFCAADGDCNYYEKIHVTPDEKETWGFEGGSKIEVYESEFGNIGILICYDIEFPELSRILAEKRIKILFVPFHTDTQNAYYRVRNCAMARAVENECYVAITGSFGILQKVENMDTQFTKSAVFSPCDFSFPVNGIIAEAEANTETLLVADVNLNLLEQLHQSGSVKNLKDRRTDLYEIRRKEG